MIPLGISNLSTAKLINLLITYRKTKMYSNLNLRWVKLNYTISKVMLTLQTISKRVLNTIKMVKLSEILRKNQSLLQI